MGLPLQVHTEPLDVKNRLAELELDETVLTDAVQRGFAAWAACTDNHPPSYPGLSAWAETVRSLRDLLASRGWRRVNESNLPLTVNESGTIAITVSTADDSTGKPDVSPCTNSAKGPKTIGAIVQNQQLLLFEETSVEVRRAISENINSPQRATWILLMHRDLVAGQVRCELSRPIGMSEDGRVDGWAERVILSPTPFDTSLVTVGDDSEPQTPEIDIDVRRRA